MTNVQVFFVAITMGAAITAIFKSSEASMNSDDYGIKNAIIPIISLTFMLWEYWVFTKEKDKIIEIVDYLQNLT